MSKRKVRYRRPGFVLNPLASQNRWAVRGRNLAFFIGSFLYVVASFILEVAISFLLKAWVFTLWLVGLCRKNETVQASKTLNGVAASAQAFSPVSVRECIGFDEVAGLEDVKRQIIQRMILPFQHPDKAKALGIPRGGGVLLFGPPGTGKTLLAKALANELGAVFFHVQPGDLIRSGVSKALDRVADLFSALRQHELVVLFLDEADDIVPNRSGSVIVHQIRGQFQRELDGFESEASGHTLLLVAATNQPWLISKAMCRPGRCDVRVYVGLPDLPARTRILVIELSKRLFDSDINPVAWAEKLSGYSGADLVRLVEQAAQNAFSRTPATEPISDADFEAAFSQVKPSVSLGDLSRFAEYCDQYQLPMEDR